MASVDLSRATAGAERRRVVRRFLGKPGSIRRWVFGSIVLVGLCIVYFMLTFDVFPLLFAGMAMIVAFVARRVLVGDEDEFNAALQQSVVRVVREGVPTEQHEAEAVTWYLRGMRGLEDAPPPPVAEESGGEPGTSPERDGFGAPILSSAPPDA